MSEMGRKRRLNCLGQGQDCPPSRHNCKEPFLLPLANFDKHYVHVKFSSMAKIAIILTPGFADWEYALIAGTGGPFYGLDIQFFSTEVGEVQSQGGLTVIILQGLDELSKWEPNAVVVIGGMIWETDQAPDIRNLLKAQRARGAVVAGICGGTLALGRAGVLDDVHHTSNEPEFLNRNASGYAGSALYVNSPFAISEDHVVTAPGTAPASFTAAIFEGVGLDKEKVAQFKAMMAAEHT